MPKNPFLDTLKVFSVCTPVYGKCYDTLPRFFHSLSEQDYKAFEVVIVFDGPNPEGEKELKRQKKKYPALKVKSAVIEHGGAPKARNAAAALAEGDYLTFIDPDVYLHSETLRMWANAFEEHPEKDVVWGLYNIILGDQLIPVGGSVPCDPSGKPDYWSFRFGNFCSGANPMRKEAFVGWDESVESLQDWDMWVRMLKKDDFKGEKFHFIPLRFFDTEAPRPGGLSDDSHKNWLDRVKYVKEKNGIPLSDICVCSLGAPFHALHVAKKLGADYLPMPSAKPHEYKAIYLLGFYPGPKVTRDHLAVFAKGGTVGQDADAHFKEFTEWFDGTKIIHWIGTDVLKMRTEVPFVTIQYLRELWQEHGVIHLTEAQHTHDEMAEIGIESTIVPIPPQKLYDPMPLPEKLTVGIYENQTQNMYHEQLMSEITRSLPDVQFYFFGDESKKGQKTKNSEHLGWIDLDEWMPKFSMNIRMTVHDGLPITPLQFLTAGRMVISNTKLNHAIYLEPDRKRLVEAVRSATVDSAAAPYWKNALSFDTYKQVIASLCKSHK